MNKVHICNMSCLCPLQGEQEAKPSRDCSIVPDRAAFSHRQMHQQGGQGFFSVVWKQFKSVIYFFLLQVQAVCMETGCQNVQLCSPILKVAFASEIIGLLYFFPLLYLLFQLGEGFLLILVFRIHERIKKANGKYSFAPFFFMLSKLSHTCLQYNYRWITALKWSQNPVTL